jgi:hypothetical protein
MRALTKRLIPIVDTIPQKRRRCEQRGVCANLPVRLECPYMPQFRITKMISQNTIFLWHNDAALDAAKFFLESTTR